MTMLISFTFNASRESEPNLAINLFRSHFPEISLSANDLMSRGVRIKATAEEFCKWMIERDQLKFVNRMHQLDMQISYIHHFAESGTITGRWSSRDGHIKPKPSPVIPYVFTTPAATGAK